MFSKFVRFVFISSIFIVATLFAHNSSANSSTGLRWAQVDKGIAAYAYRAGAMMIEEDKISSISQIYGSLLFDGIRWYSNMDRTTFPRSDHMGNMFLDSRGVIYVGGVRADYDGLNTPYSYIFETTDGLNYTPVKEFIDFTGGGIIWNFTEDKYGNVWAGEYTPSTTTTGAHLWRRRPDGIWTNVANWETIQYHIHNVYYDPYRDALYISIGDKDLGILKLPSSLINAEDISVNDFSYILPTFPDGTPLEVTAMTSDANYLYVGLDMHSPYGSKTRAIARITDNNVTQTVEVVYPLEGCTVWRWADVDDSGNIIFSSTGIDEWSCDNNFVNQIVVSSDSGTTWTMVKDFGSSSTSIGLKYTGLASYYSNSWSGLYGGGNGWGGANLRASIGRVVPANTTFYVDGINGVDWTNFGISISQPIKTLNYLEMLDIQPGDTVQFIGNNSYSAPLIAGWNGDGSQKISLKGNNTSVFTGGSVANAPPVAETFELDKALWNFTLNETGGSITADTSVVHSGAQSAKVVRGETETVYMRLNNVAATNLTEGDTMYLDYWVYYPEDQTSGSDQGMLRILDNSDYELKLRLNPQSTGNLLNEISVNIPAWSSWYIPARHSLASGTWHKIYIEDYLHSTDGSFKMYVDDVLWQNINGIKTITPSGKIDRIFFYNYENPITYYIDDLRFGKSQFDDRGAINTNNYSYLDIGGFRIQGTNGIDISSNSTDIDLHDSIFNGLTNDAIMNFGNVNINIYYNTIFGSGRYGVYSASHATLINNVVYSSSSNDIFIVPYVFVNGGHNWFMDSVQGGAGTYIDAGSTTWSGADPNFVNSSTGDFHLLIYSPLVDAGSVIAGFTTDFDGTMRPQGIATDIGAYELSYKRVLLPFASAK